MKRTDILTGNGQGDPHAGVSQLLPYQRIPPSICEERLDNVVGGDPLGDRAYGLCEVDCRQGTCVLGCTHYSHRFIFLVECLVRVEAQLDVVSPVVHVLGENDPCKVKQQQ